MRSLINARAQFGRRTASNRGLHRIEQLVRAGERPYGRGMLGDPGRILENVRERRDEVVCLLPALRSEIVVRDISPSLPDIERVGGEVRKIGVHSACAI